LKKIENPFCAVPFTTAFNTQDNLFRDCCSKNPKIVSSPGQTFDQWWASDALESFRQQLSKSQWPDECLRCKVEEKAINKSFRTEVNSQFPESIDYSYPSAWNVKFGNLCNLACWSCNEGSSSVIYEHKKKLGLETKFTHNAEDEFQIHWPELEKSILKSYQFHDEVKLTLLGGEPLYNKTVKDFLGKLIRLGLAHRTRLEFHTNGTVLPEKLLPSRDKSPWKYICIFISLDAVGKFAEWLRYGCSWPKIERNVDNLKNSCDYAEIHCVVTILNINHLSQLDRYAAKNNIELVMHHAHTPYWLSLAHWDLDKKDLLVYSTNSKFKEFYDLIGTQPRIGSSDRTRQYIRSFDSIRKPLSAFDSKFAQAMDW